MYLVLGLFRVRHLDTHYPSPRKNAIGVIGLYIFMRFRVAFNFTPSKQKTTAQKDGRFSKMRRSQLFETIPYLFEYQVDTLL